jgi:hypothetical protein
MNKFVILRAPTVTVFGSQPFEVLKQHYAQCRALIFPGEEDFGMVPVEAMASGRPVIAFGRGGAAETVAKGRVRCLLPRSVGRDNLVGGQRFGEYRKSSLKRSQLMQTNSAATSSFRRCAPTLIACSLKKIARIDCGTGRNDFEPVFSSIVQRVSITDNDEPSMTRHVRRPLA